LLPPIQLFSVFCCEGYPDKGKKQSCPPPIKHSDHPKPTRRENRDKKEWKQQKEECSKYNNSIAGVYRSKDLHGSKCNKELWVETIRKWPCENLTTLLRKSAPKNDSTKQLACRIQRE